MACGTIRVPASGGAQAKESFFIVLAGGHKRKTVSGCNQKCDSPLSLRSHRPRPVRDAMRIARHFAGLSDNSAASPLGTPESSPDVGHRRLSKSVVPTGLILEILPHNPGTEVPGYFHGVPTGRKMVRLQTPAKRSLCGNFPQQSCLSRTSGCTRRKPGLSHVSIPLGYTRVPPDGPGQSK